VPTGAFTSTVSTVVISREGSFSLFSTCLTAGFPSFAAAAVKAAGTSIVATRPQVNSRLVSIFFIVSFERIFSDDDFGIIIFDISIYRHIWDFED
jgi:hypothetical protein